MATQELTQEKAIEYWTEYQRLISVGAYTERSAEHYESNTWPEDGIEESVYNLTQWALRQDLEFCWDQTRKTWSLEPIDYEEAETEKEEPPEEMWCEYHKLYHWPCF